MCRTPEREGMSILLWIQFCLAFVAGAAILYLPGYLILRLARLNNLESTLIAPLITLAVLGIEEIVFSALHIPGSWLTLLLPLLILLGLLEIITAAANKKRNIHCSPHTLVIDAARQNWLTLLPYLFVSFVVVNFVILLQLNRPDSFVQLYDNAWHMSLIEKFVSTGDLSTLHSGNIVDTLGSTFYPTGWHSIVALVVSLTHFSIPLSLNAVNCVIMILVFPSSMYFLAQQVFQSSRKIVIYGSLVVMMFTAFPWYFTVFGPLYSNLLSFGALPVLIALGLVMVQAHTSLRTRIVSIVLWLVALVGVGVTQPNAAFTMGVLVAPYLFAQLPQFIGHGQSHRNLKVASTALGLFAAICMVWVGLYKAPFMQRTVTWQWPAFESKRQALWDVAFLGFGNTPSIYLLGVLVMAGLVFTLLHREYLWMSVAYAIMCFMYWVSSSSEGRTKKILTGFWYHDQFRLAASTVFYGILLAALGMYVCFRALTQLMHRVSFLRSNSVARRAITSLVIVTVLAGVYYPGNLDAARQTDQANPTPFGRLIELTRKWNDPHYSRPYSAQEESFVEKVTQHIPHNAVVLNMPYDGSAYAYAMNGVNVYYKAWEGNWMGQPSPENELLRTRLNEIATDSEVQRAAQKVGARYLLLLDRSEYQPQEGSTEELANEYALYNTITWRGILSVTDSTPGFTVLLKQGKMRLYKLQ